MYVGVYSNGKFHGKGNHFFTQEYILGQINQDMREILLKVLDRVMEYGQQITLIQRAINMKEIIKMIKRMDLENISGKMELLMKDISSMILNMEREL